MDTFHFKQLAVQLRRSLVDAGIPVDGIILFGSRARDTARVDSDIDLAILSRAFGNDRFKEGSLVNIHAHRVHPAIEAVPVSLHDWFERDPISPLLHEIQREGIFLL